MANTRVTQKSVRVLINSPIPLNTRVTQKVVRILLYTPIVNNTRVTQMSLRILASNSASSSSGSIYHINHINNIGIGKSIISIKIITNSPKVIKIYQR